MIRTVGAFVGALALTTVPSVWAPAQATPEPQAWILVDGETGDVLDARNHHEPRPAASTVKLMTALTALQRLPGIYDLGDGSGLREQRVTTTPAAADAPSPRLGMQETSTWQLRDVLQGMLLTSANDAAYTLAEGSSGSLPQFATDMTALGEHMGVEDSTFADPAGLDDESAFGGGTLMSAYDLAVVARNVLAVPELVEIVALEDYRLVLPDGTETALRPNANDFLTAYDGATGLKSGFTSRAGRVLVASAEREGRTMIAVVLGAEEPNDFAAGLLDAGFATAAGKERDRERVPEPRANTLHGRLVALTALPRPLGMPPLGLGPSGPGAPIEPAPPATAASRPERRPRAAGEGGFPVLAVPALLAAVALVVFLLWRRHVLERERRHQVARRRALAEARRRGTLDVIDPDVTRDPSHVRVVRR